ncbi:Retinol dehydrogenase 12 [Entomophthora muscae]|uniref:Retinol dehydrogenase 12 n=2 Tax=Entomophthora muscae TaxID=34485 RepID=A0ACC2TND5_9FUNG|nr:Retinol dehydrogenase 12 [Entomophthora muscae]
MQATWSVKIEEQLLNNFSTQLWIPLNFRFLLNGFVAQFCHFYYRVMGAYSAPEERIASYISQLNLNEQKVAIVTGANTGIGFETARALGKAGYRVILACRSQMKAEKAIGEILKDYPTSNLKFMELDLASFNSVRRFAEKFNEQETQLDLLINNAGIMILPTYQETEDGNEMQYQVNYLSTFLLTRLLISKLKAAKQSKIINLSSLAHYNAGECDFSTVNNKESYCPNTSYCLSKAALIMMTYSLNKKLADSDIKAYAVHPGIVHTELLRYRSVLYFFSNIVGKYMIKSALEGALTVIRLSLVSEEGSQDIADPSIYYTDDLPMQPLVWTRDQANQESLWRETSKALCLDESLSS